MNEKVTSAKSILIVGGGPTGVELAGEIAVDFPDKKVTIVHRGSRLTEFIGAKASKKALNWLVKRKVDVLLGQSVNVDAKTEEGTYVTSNGETIAADCHFVCVGAKLGSSWLQDTRVKVCLDSNGRVMVDEHLRVKGHKNIFAIGDITDVPVSKIFLLLCLFYGPLLSSMHMCKALLFKSSSSHDLICSLLFELELV